MTKLKELNKTRYAKGRLKKLAGKRAHAIEYKIVQFSTGDIGILCDVYIHGYEHAHGKTWDEAFENLQQQIKERGDHETKR